MKNERHVVLISIDAMITSDIAEFRKRKNMGKLLEKASYVDEVHCIYPTYTYPCHASIMTGCYPERHGIYHNDVFNPFSSHDEWFWYSRAIKVPTMVDVARKAGLVTSTVVFPVQGGNSADYCIPEIWNLEMDADPDDAFLPATSEKALPIYRRHKGELNWMKTPEFDYFSTNCACDIIREARPHLLCMHLSYLDHQRHNNGFETEKVLHAIDFIDERVGEVVKAVEDAGIMDSTDFILLGDHGHIIVHNVFNINMLLKERGYIDVDESGKVMDFRIMVHSTSFSGHVYCRDVDLDEARKVLDEIRESYPEYVERVLTAYEAEEIYHLSGPFDFVLECQTNVIFGSALSGDLVCHPEKGSYKYSFSTHGFAPEKGANPPFIISGPDAKAGVHVRNARLIDEAPTVLDILGLSMPTAQGRCIDGLLKNPGSANNI